MKVNLFISALLILILCNSKVIAQKENQFDDQGKKQGRWVHFKDTSYESTVMDVIICNYINDTLNGKYKRIEDEKTVYEADYEMGKKNGVERIYLNGRVKQISYYNKNTLLHLIEFYQKGNIKREVIFTEDHNEEERRTYYENGILWSKSSYINGIIEGEEISYDKKGNESFVIKYKDGKAIE